MVLADLSGVFHDGVLYVGGREVVHARDVATGEKRWENTAVPGTPHSVVDGVLYVVGREGLQALDAATGEKRWENTAVPGTVHSIVDEVVYVVGHEERLHGLDAATGEERWQSVMEFPYEAADMPIVVADGVVYTGGCIETDGSRLGYRGTITGCGTFAVDAATGENVWYIILDATYRGAVPHSVADGVLYMTNSYRSPFDGSRSDALLALDAARGPPGRCSKTRWASGVSRAAKTQATPLKLSRTAWCTQDTWEACTPWTPPPGRSSGFSVKPTPPELSRTDWST